MKQVKFTAQKLLEVIPHVFLPRQLPTEEQTDLSNVETNLLEILTCTISSLNSTLFQYFFPRSTELFQKWKEVQQQLMLSDGADEVMNTIKEMNSGDMIAMYIRAQNAGLLITLQPAVLAQECKKEFSSDRNFIFSSFQASLHNEVIMSATGNRIITVPESSVEVSSTLLESEEFAEQLGHLTRQSLSIALPKSKKAGRKFDEVRDTADPMLITDWATATLCTKNSISSQNFPRICKKVRDDVIWKNCLQPFRRSGLWMTAKIALQISLIRELGEEIGTLIYKTIMVKAMYYILDQLCMLSIDERHWDLRVQMMRKIARRVEKLKLTLNQVKAVHKLAHSTVTVRTIFIQITSGLEMMRNEMDCRWNKISDSMHKNSNQLDFSEQLLRDTVHGMEELKNYIQQQTLLGGRDVQAPNIPPPNCPNRLKINFTDIFPDFTQHLTGTGYDLDFKLWEVEVWIRNHIDECCSKEYSKNISNLITDYSECASKHYDNDPIANSRMILTVLKCLEVLDRIAVHEYPMLAEHKSGVDLSVLELLLLPLKSEMELAHNLEKYFSKRDSLCTFPSLIEESKPTSNSFSVRFAKENTAMNELRFNILIEAEQDIERKKEEVLRVRSECNDLEPQIESILHESRYSLYKGRYTHPAWCKRCLLERQLEEKKLSVIPYERPLSLDEDKQCSVVFELLIPCEVSCLRDMLMLFQVEVLFRDCSLIKREKNLKNWNEYSHSAIIATIQPAFVRSNEFHVVQLGSTTASCLGSHYRNTLSVYDLPESFILNNGMNETYLHSCVISSSDTLKRKCTFQIGTKTCYGGLQWTLNGTSHTLNQVLARQNECSKELSLPEFIQFGSLRAGHRLQYRNIIMSLVNGKLSVKAESVFILLCQAQWQAGPRSKTVFRESHKDFSEPEFAEESLNIIETLVEENSKTWSDPYTMLNLIVITARVLDLVEDDVIRRRAAGILRKCRCIGNQWINTLKGLMANNFNEPENQKNLLRLKLINVALVSALTFHVRYEYNELVMELPTDLSMWLNSVSTLYDEVHWNSARVTSLLSQVEVALIRLSVNIGVSLESHMKRLITQDQGNCLSTFTRDRWKVAKSFDAPWEFCPFPYHEIYECKRVTSTDDDDIHVVHLDIILGKFLVDGCPVRRLPETIIKNSSYQRVFRTADFQVQPNKNQVFTTTTTFHGCTYSFKLENDNLIIKETNREKGSSLQMIPHTLLHEEVPIYLMENYTHWWDKSNNRILFRPKSFENIQFYSSINFILDLSIMTLKEFNGGRFMIYIKTPSFNKLTSVLNRIEPLEYIHIWMRFEHKKRDLEVELAKLRLKFNFEDGILFSHEFPGMKLCENQNFGSLVGLENKLILEGKQLSNSFVPIQKVIVPHSNIFVLGGQSHQAVKVNLEALQTPRFFVYEVDHRFQILRAGRNQTAWLYLALLHGSTASPLPDTFTGVTGTEMAFQILQSGRCWSCQPYDNESEQMLNCIANLSPKRTYHPKQQTPKEQNLLQMQQVIWPPFIPPSAAHEGFVLIVHKLINDSKRLLPLFGNVLLSKENKDLNAHNLMLRHYWRQAPLENELSTISAQFDMEFQKTRPPQIGYQRSTLVVERKSKIHAVRLIADLCHGWKCCLDTNMVKYVKNLLISSANLSGKSPNYLQALSTSNISNWLDYDLRNKWIDLYSFALEVDKQCLRSRWTLILCTLAFNGVPLEHLLILHAVAVHPTHFPVTPNYFTYTQPSGLASNFSISNVSAVFQSHSKPFSEFDSVSLTEELRNKAIEEHNELIKELVTLHTQSVVTQWPTSSYNPTTYSSRINILGAKTEMDARLKTWFENHSLKEFVTRVSLCLKTVICCSLQQNVKPNIAELIHQEEIIYTKIPFFIDFKDYMKSRVEGQIDETAAFIFETGNWQSSIQENSNQRIKSFETELSDLYAKSNQLNVTLKKAIVPPEAGALVASGLYPRLTPSFLMQLLLQENNDEKSICIRNVVGAIGVLWALEQRLIRCISYSAAGSSMEVALEREIETKGFDNWSPRDHPGWLVLQLEMNMMIRPIQLKVAQEMMTSKTGKNSVMQLNMGEGKTSLIVPMLAISLANKKQLCRVTVLKSIFETNYNALRHTLGGILNRRVCTIPCRRDLNIGTKEISLIQKTYQEFIQNQGVVVSLPEYRLSFQLKGLEMARKGDAALANSFIRVQEWMNTNVRDILDESDEILSVKYQLVYAVGSQLSIGGGEMRWIVVQKLLKRLPEQMKKLWEIHGDSVVEYDQGSFENGSHFTPCRLLRNTCYQELIDLLADDFLDGKMISFRNLKEHEKKLVNILLTDNKLAKRDIENAFKLFEDNPKNLEIVLILSGLLRFEVLQSALSKRWRVNYGVNPKGNRKMAVPFKAKDVASERTEFGHPDMAIVLTHLSYYYSGLKDEHLHQCFDILKNRHRSPVDEFDSWIKTIPEEDVDPSVRNYNGINLADYNQRTRILFPLLRKNMAVIDFWLCHIVFPKESKQFPGKMTCTAWDLCSDNQKLLTTGFSGTNDSSNLLPLRISQNDLPELQNTNKKLEAILLLQENNNYKQLPSGVSCRIILQLLKEENIKVILDCGALMLELNNEEVAQEWLEIDQSIKAVVYFNQSNVLTVKSRNSSDTQLELSPFREGLEGCAVYLDDEHTRGTDLKFPIGSLACVTVGSGLTRDKMVQACMRMRLLGKGHRVTFWASHEAHHKIRDLSGSVDSVGSNDVLNWVCANSKEFESDGLIYWTTAGVNYCRKLAAELVFRQSPGLDFPDVTKKFQLFGNQCTEDEVISLDDMYGHAREENFFVQIISSWFAAARRSLEKKDGGKPIFEDGFGLFEGVLTPVYSRCRRLIPEKKYFSQLLEEEQEKELENELEEEEEVERPGAAEPHQHSLHPDVRRAAYIGRIPRNIVNNSIVKLPFAFRNTTIWKNIQEDCWGDNIYVTDDFVKTVIQNRLDPDNEYIAPPCWIVSMIPDSRTEALLLVISPFEANELIESFRTSALKSSLHLYTPRLLPNKNLLITNPKLMLPSSKPNINLNLSESLLSPLFLFSGNLYFNNEKEQSAFSNFLGIIPRPMTNEQDKAFNKGLICQNGFVKPEHRKKVNFSETRSFHQNPESLVTEILRTRHQGFFSPDSHVAVLVRDGKKTLFLHNSTIELKKEKEIKLEKEEEDFH